MAQCIDLSAASEKFGKAKGLSYNFLTIGQLQLYWLFANIIKISLLTKLFERPGWLLLFCLEVFIMFVVVGDGLVWKTIWVVRIFPNWSPMHSHCMLLGCIFDNWLPLALKIKNYHSASWVSKSRKLFKNISSNMVEFRLIKLLFMLWFVPDIQTVQMWFMWMQVLLFESVLSVS